MNAGEYEHWCGLEHFELIEGDGAAFVVVVKGVAIVKMR